MKSVEYYQECFRTLHANKQKGTVAPHKALLLLAIIDLIEQGLIFSDKIMLTDELQDKFNSLWKYYIGKSTIFSPDVFKPYYHMGHEPFWKLVPIDPNNDVVEEPRYNKSWIRSKYRYAHLDEELYKYLQEGVLRSQFRLILIGNYLVNQPIELSISDSNKSALSKLRSILMLFVA